MSAVAGPAQRPPRLGRDDGADGAVVLLRGGQAVVVNQPAFAAQSAEVDVEIALIDVRAATEVDALAGAGNQLAGGVGGEVKLVSDLVASEKRARLDARRVVVVHVYASFGVCVTGRELLRDYTMPSAGINRGITSPITGVYLR